MPVFDSYDDAAKFARKRAQEHHKDMTIRKVKEFGKTRYVVNYKTNDGSDYLGETVKADAQI